MSTLSVLTGSLAFTLLRGFRFGGGGGGGFLLLLVLVFAGLLLWGLVRSDKPTA
jgi:hypothetical protein